jgi:N4-gp56 family major capsid protein
MANALPSRIGQANQTGAVDALFLKVFGGEVLTAFAESNVFLGRTMVRTISAGKSAQFPSSWKGTAAYHVPGTELNGTKIGHNERVITIDDLLVADRFIANIDEAMNHYDVRSEYSRDVGRALSGTMDRNLARIGYLAARTASNITGLPGGAAITSATSKTNADALVQAIFDAAATLDKNDVPDTDRTVFVTPDQYYLLINSSSKAVHADYNASGSNGGVAEGKIYRVAGIPIVKSNHMPTTDQSADATIAANYRGNFATSTALVMHKSAVGTVKLMDLAVEAEYQIQRQGTLIVGKYAVGHGVLRPEAAVEIKTA